MESAVLIETVKQAPTLAILCWVVYTFLKHMASVEQSRREVDEKRDSHLEVLGKGCHDFQHKLWQQAHEVFGQSAAAINKNTTALDRVTESLAKFEQRNLGGK